MAALLFAGACDGARRDAGGGGGGGNREPVASSDDLVGGSPATTANTNSTIEEADAEGAAGYRELDASGEAYARIPENPFLTAAAAPLSTFSIDVDTASYSNTRRFLTSGQLPPADAVRIEELVNYFTYDYPQPTGDVPFSINAEVAECPWEPAHRLARIGLKGKDVARGETPPRNLVFLVDVSGSMESEDKLPLVKSALSMLARQLTPRDRIALVAYAGAAGLVLPSTPGGETGEILAAINRLSAGGSTAGGAGIRLAYAVAREGFIEGGVNRVVLATDGDFNVGVASEAELVALIEQKRASGVSLSVLGVGTGNLQDSKMEALADTGNGNYAYLDSRDEARRVLVDQVGGTLVTIAKDVKVQVEFNPATVAAYRLIGYENRLMAARDFGDDRKDAGEIGAGHTVTALYEVVPAGTKVPVADDGGLRYQEPPRLSERAASGELLTVRLRYKEPDGDASRLLNAPVVDLGTRLAGATADFRFAAAVAGFGMLLRDSRFKGNATFDRVAGLAEGGMGEDRAGYRAEFLGLVRTAEGLRRRG